MKELLIKAATVLPLSIVAVGDAVKPIVDSSQFDVGLFKFVTTVASEAGVTAFLIFAIVWLMKRLKEKEDKIEALQEKLLKAYERRALA